MIWKVIRPSISQHKLATFIVRNHSEIKRGKTKMIINYKILNDNNTEHINEKKNNILVDNLSRKVINFQTHYFHGVDRSEDDELWECQSTRVAPQESNLWFRWNNLEKLPKRERCLLDNLWITRDSKQTLDNRNALANHFRQIHNIVESRIFCLFALIKGRKPDIYNYWPEVLQEVERFLDPLFKGFYTLEEVLNFCREMIGFNFYIFERVRQTVTMQIATSQPSSLSIQLCDSCEIMTNVVKNLNLKKHSLEERLQILEDKISYSQ